MHDEAMCGDPPRFIRLVGGMVLARLVLVAQLIASPVPSLSAEHADSAQGPRATYAITGVNLDAARVAPVAPVAPAAPVAPFAFADTVTRRRRPVAIEYSDWYERRATIHRLASWTTLPLFAAEVVTGQELFRNGPDAADWAQDSHGIIAGSLAGLFALNTVTGVWNLWDARHDPSGRKWRTVHAVLMLAADAGFAYAGALAEDAEESSDTRRQHRTVAISASSVALLS